MLYRSRPLQRRGARVCGFLFEVQGKMQACSPECTPNSDSCPGQTAQLAPKPKYREGDLIPNQFSVGFLLGKLSSSSGKALLTIRYQGARRKGVVRRMPHWAKCFPYTYEDLAVEPQNLYKNQARVVHIWNPNPVEAETGASLGLAGQLVRLIVELQAKGRSCLREGEWCSWGCPLTSSSKGVL